MTDSFTAWQAQVGNEGMDEVAEAKGTYARQPIEASFVGGTLLSLRDAATPYRVSLKVANGPTRATLLGSVQDPLNFTGTDLKLEIAGTGE